MLLQAAAGHLRSTTGEREEEEGVRGGRTEPIGSLGVLSPRQHNLTDHSEGGEGSKAQKE